MRRLNRTRRRTGLLKLLTQARQGPAPSEPTHQMFESALAAALALVLPGEYSLSAPRAAAPPSDPPARRLTIARPQHAGIVGGRRRTTPFAANSSSMENHDLRFAARQARAADAKRLAVAADAARAAARKTRAAARDFARVRAQRKQAAAQKKQRASQLHAASPAPPRKRKRPESTVEAVHCALSNAKLN